MQVKFTVLYEGGSLVFSSGHFDLIAQDEDPQSFDEARDYFQDNFIDILETDGYVFEENDEDEEDIGSDYLGSWVVYEYEDMERDDARALGLRLASEANVVLEDLE